MSNIIKGLIIGLIVSFPIGPLGIISIKRTINSGWEEGFASGLGAAASDVIYSSSAIFGISFCERLIHKHISLINEVTGILFIIVGINIFINSLKNNIDKVEFKNEQIHPTITNFLLGLSNPITFIIFMTIFAKIEIKTDVNEIIHKLLFVSSIFIGSGIFWLVTSNLIDKCKKGIRIEQLCIFNKIAAISITLFGIINILKGIIG